MNASLSAEHPLVFVRCILSVLVPVVVIFIFIFIFFVVCSVFGFFNLAGYECGKIVKGLLDFGCGDAFFLGGLNTLRSQCFCLRVITVGGQLDLLDFLRNPGLDKLESARTHV